MNRFESKFLDEFIKFSKEYGFVIIDGYLQPIQDWVENGKNFRYVTSEDDNGIKITDIQII